MLCDTNAPIPGSYADLFKNFGNPGDANFADDYITQTDHEIAGGVIVTIRHHVQITTRLHNIWQALTDTDQLGLIQSYDGCYVVRDIRGSAAPSLHSWGLAIDLNAAQYPLGSLDRQPHALTVLFEAQGFFYGGDFYNRKDPMHYQLTVPHTI